jgi:hypothetical protein
MLKKVELFFTFLTIISKIFLVGFAKVGKNTNIRSNDGFEFFHLAWHRNSGFDNSYIMLIFNLPHRQRNTYL